MDREQNCGLLISLLCFFSNLGVSHGSQEAAGIHIHSMHVDCKVTSRFARTVITTNLINKVNASVEATFDVELPKLAFITNFSMTVNGVTTIATVKEKEAAKKKYMTAVSRGQTAGLVQSSGRKMEHFKVSVNIAASATATFKLTYEELLKRHLGNYELLIKVRPKQLVEHFQVDAHIVEPEGISYLEASGTFMTNDLTDAIHKNVSATKAHVVFKPTLQQQQKCPDCRETLLDGDFIIKYDVKRVGSAGSIQVVNGYFVHYFAPGNLQKVPKNVVFVIDRSGSMHGRKIQQTREALLKILGDVPAEDHFGIVIFDDADRKWKDTLVRASPANITEAKEFISNINARGGTDINHALLVAVDMISEAKGTHLLREMSTSIIIILTDGDPTSGVTNPKEIQQNVKAAINGRYTLYCLGFGQDVDYNFLKKMALENGGLARRIYEDSDSALQLQGFYNEVANPMLLDVELQYLENSVSDITQNNFRHYYNGSELMVAGRITNNNLEMFKSNITAQAVYAPLSLHAEVNVKELETALKEQEYIFGDYIERLWACLTIEQLLTQMVSARGGEKSNLTEKALRLSLKYHFVTPLTSMVVTASDDEEKKRDEKKDLVANKPGEEGHFPIQQYEYDELMYGHQEPSSQMDSIIVDSHYYVNFDHPHGSSVHAIANSIPLPILAEDYDSVYDTEFSVPFPTIIEGDGSVHATEVSTPHPTIAGESVDAQIILRIPALDRNVCLMIDEDQGTILNLVTDTVSAIIVNGQLIHGSSNTHSYFGKFGLMNKNRNLKAEITTTNITIFQDENVQTYPWTSPLVQTSFLHKEGREITVTMDTGVKFAVVLYQQPYFLKLYVKDSHLLSNRTFGLLGQFFSDGEIKAESKPSSAGTVLTVHGQTLTAISAWQRHYEGGPEGSETDQSCWLVHNNGSGLVDGIHTSYIISDIFDTSFIH